MREDVLTNAFFVIYTGAFWVFYMKKDLILVYPKIGIYGTIIIDLPLALIHASRLAYSKGYSIKIIDCRIDDDWKKTLLESLKNDPYAVMISAMTGKPIQYALEVSKFVKDNSNTLVVWGGIHPTLLPMQTLEHPLIDAVVQGDGEVTLYEMLEALEHGKSFHGIAGLHFKENGKLIQNPKRSPTDLNALPDEIPPYDLVDIKKYRRQGFNETSFSILTSSGCPHRCTFCHVPATDSKWIPEDVGRTMRHIKYVMDKYHPDYLYINDNDFFVNLKRAEALFEEIKKEKIDVVVGFRGTRVDELTRADHKLFSLMEDIGVRELHIGAESGSQRILDYIKKGIKVQNTVDVNRRLTKHPKIRPSYNFFTGVPGETEHDLYLTTNLVIKLLRENPYAQISSMTEFAPYPGTELYDIDIKQGYQPPQTLQEWADLDPGTAAKKCPWINQNRKRLMDMLYFTALFVDRKIEWHFLSNKPHFFLFRNMSKVYRPVARFRMKHHISAMPVEVHLKNLFYKYLEKNYA